MKTSIKKLVFGLMIVGVLMPLAVQAQTPTTYTPLAPLPCIESPEQKDPATGAIIPAIKCDKGNGSLAETVTFQTYVQYVFNLAIALAAVAAVFMMVYGGFLYMTSSAVTTKEDGLKKVQHAVGGLALVLCSFLILKTINPQFVQVPASLVTPLGLSAPNLAADWLTTLKNMQSVDALNANNADARKTIADATAASAVLQQQLTNDQKNASDVCDPESNNYDEVECEVALNDAIAAQDALNQLKSNTVFVTAKKEMDTQVVLAEGQGCTPKGDPQACATQVQKTANIYVTASGQLQPDQLKQLQSQALYDDAILNMTAQAATFHQDAVANIADDKENQNTITAINNTADSYIKSPGAIPALVTQLKTQQQNILATVNRAQ
jgi:hypothetical protein